MNGDKGGAYDCCCDEAEEISEETEGRHTVLTDHADVDDRVKLIKSTYTELFTHIMNTRHDNK